MLKMAVPLTSEAITSASARARSIVRHRQPSHGPPLPAEYERWYAAHQNDPHAPPPFAPPFGFHPPPPPPHYFNGMPPPPPWNGAGPPGPPPHPPAPPLYPGAAPSTSQAISALRSRSGSTEAQRNVVHRGVACGGCRKEIVGIRWLCANCPSNPTFNLVGFVSVG